MASKVLPGLCSIKSTTTIKRRFADFKRGRTDTDDAERSGRTNEAVIPENIEKTHKTIMGDCKVKLQKIADTLKLSFEGRNCQQKAAFEEEKSAVSDNESCYKSMTTMIKIHELGFELLPHPLILQIWPLATTGSSQTSKRCSVEKELAQMRK